MPKKSALSDSPARKGEPATALRTNRLALWLNVLLCVGCVGITLLDPTQLAAPALPPDWRDALVMLTLGTILFYALIYAMRPFFSIERYLMHAAPLAVLAAAYAWRTREASAPGVSESSVC